MSDEEPRWGDTHGHPGCYGCQMCFSCLLDDLDVDGLVMNGPGDVQEHVQEHANPCESDDSWDDVPGP